MLQPTAASETPLQNLLRLDGRVAVVTGGARGIGFATARRLAEAGADIVIADVDADAARAACDQLIEADGRACVSICDVRSPSDVQRVVDRAVEVMGGIHIWVNNAGIYPYGDVFSMSEQVLEDTIAINLTACFWGAALAGRAMSLRGGGVILNIASIDGLRPTSGRLIHYQASKHGVVGLTYGFAKELGPLGIRVLAVAPGGVDTEGNVARMESTEAVVKPGDVPLRRRANPDDVARVAVMLVSDAAEYMTGCVIPIEGGWLIR